MSELADESIDKNLDDEFFYGTKEAREKSLKKKGEETDETD